MHPSPPTSHEHARADRERDDRGEKCGLSTDIHEGTIAACSMSDAMVILDGPVGTELNARGVRTELPLWSAAANETHPEVVSAIHRDYAGAGATVHTTNTFRTRRRLMPGRWRELTTRAVELARGAVPRSHRVAGSIAPLEDCYRPDLSPPDGVFRAPGDGRRPR